MSKKQQFPSDKQDQFMIRLPNGMRDRIKEVAEENNRSMNAEIVSTLEKAYPPKTLDIRVLSEFLEGLVGVSAPDGDKEYLDYLNGLLAKAKQPWTVRAGWDGAVTFYPYASHIEDDEKASDTVLRSVAELARGEDFETVEAVAEALKNRDVDAALRALKVDPTQFQEFEQAMKSAGNLMSGREKEDADAEPSASRRQKSVKKS